MSDHLSAPDCYGKLVNLVGPFLSRDDVTTFDCLLSDYAEAVGREATYEARDAFVADLGIVKDYLPDASGDVKIVLAWLEDRTIFGHSREGR